MILIFDFFSFVAFNALNAFELMMGKNFLVKLIEIRYLISINFL